jgi:FkbM family methyltransferase
MSAIGRYIKLRYPSFYNHLIGVINSAIAMTRPYSIYITDNLGGSFKNYFLENNMPDKINTLKRNLDGESINVIEVVLKRLQFYPDQKDKRKVNKGDLIIGGFLPVETVPQVSLIEEQLTSISKTVKLPIALIEESVFYFHHGLSLLPSSVIEYIQFQHFIDLGAYVGDSAIALSKYQYSKIFSMEISKKSIERYQLNMKVNNIQEDKYAILNIGVASSDVEPSIKMNDTGSAGFSLYRSSGKYDEIEIERKSLDWIVEKNSIQPKFIKVDIEGAAMDFVKGATKTLVKFRPVLSIAIYHNPVEFFEIKPTLEKLLTDYTFVVKKLASGVKNNLCHSEVVLLAYPKELLQQSFDN